ncbi:MAG TPA: DUF2330 domain-containing protein [Oligoflexia bacterium]|nr:DUF2330 domain-containing protein [Oligoflexia bacterium]HMP49775.1 DUF2330 domain-containing protein [Oligoflexia bacterium]
MKLLKNYLIFNVLFLSAILAFKEHALAFCGFYIGKADTKLFNEASKVVVVRDGNRTVISMASDFKGELKEFALVIPVPTMIKEDQIHVASNALIDHLDSYTAPRLVEYYDENPCEPIYRMRELGMPAGEASDGSSLAKAKSLGVKIEAEYTVGEYDIVLLSATQSDGLGIWLNENGYKMPENAKPVLESYIKQNTKFFLAKVNLKEQSKLGFNFLRPLQVAFESPKFMLPIRLGTVNANGSQEMFVFMLTKNGRVETTNYRTVKIASDIEVPNFIKDEFGSFYKTLYNKQVEKEGRRAVFLEYAWDMGWCDPCAADPLSNSELKELGVMWLDEANELAQNNMFGNIQGQRVFVTRLHLTYDKDHFPEDLIFNETADKTNFQARYIIRHPWTGSDSCKEADKYRENLKNKNISLAKSLAENTGWNLEEISTKMNLSSIDLKNPANSDWWKSIWKK